MGPARDAAFVLFFYFVSFAFGDGDGGLNNSGKNFHPNNLKATNDHSLSNNLVQNYNKNFVQNNIVQWEFPCSYGRSCSSTKSLTKRSAQIDYPPDHPLYFRTTPRPTLLNQIPPISNSSTPTSFTLPLQQSQQLPTTSPIPPTTSQASASKPATTPLPMKWFLFYKRGEPFPTLPPKTKASRSLDTNRRQRFLGPYSRNRPFPTLPPKRKASRSLDTNRRQRFLVPYSRNRPSRRRDIVSRPKKSKKTEPVQNSNLHKPGNDRIADDSQLTNSDQQNNPLIKEYQQIYDDLISLAMKQVEQANAEVEIQDQQKLNGVISFDSQNQKKADHVTKIHSQDQKKRQDVKSINSQDQNKLNNIMSIIFQDKNERGEMSINSKGQKKRNEVTSIYSQIEKKHNDVISIVSQDNKQRDDVMSINSQDQKKRNKVSSIHSQVEKKRDDIMPLNSQDQKKRNDVTSIHTQSKKKHQFSKINSQDQIKRNDVISIHSQYKKTIPQSNYLELIGPPKNDSKIPFDENKSTNSSYTSRIFKSLINNYFWQSNNRNKPNKTRNQSNKRFLSPLTNRQNNLQSPETTGLDSLVTKVKTISNKFGESLRPVHKNIPMRPSSFDHDRKDRIAYLSLSDSYHHSRKPPAEDPQGKAPESFKQSNYPNPENTMTLLLTTSSRLEISPTVFVYLDELNSATTRQIEVKPIQTGLSDILKHSKTDGSHSRPKHTNIISTNNVEDSLVHTLTTKMPNSATIQINPAVVSTKRSNLDYITIITAFNQPPVKISSKKDLINMETSPSKFPPKSYVSMNNQQKPKKARKNLSSFFDEVLAASFRNRILNNQRSSFSIPYYVLHGWHYPEIISAFALKLSSSLLRQYKNLNLNNLDVADAEQDGQLPYIFLNYLLSGKLNKSPQYPDANTLYKVLLQLFTESEAKGGYDDAEKYLQAILVTLGIPISSLTNALEESFIYYLLQSKNHPDQELNYQSGLHPSYQIEPSSILNHHTTSVNSKVLPPIISTQQSEYLMSTAEHLQGLKLHSEKNNALIRGPSTKSEHRSTTSSESNNVGTNSLKHTSQDPKYDTFNKEPQYLLKPTNGPVYLTSTSRTGNRWSVNTILYNDGTYAPIHNFYFEKNNPTLITKVTHLPQNSFYKPHKSDLKRGDMDVHNSPSYTNRHISHYDSKYKKEIVDKLHNNAQMLSRIHGDIKSIASNDKDVVKVSEVISTIVKIMSKDKDSYMKGNQPYQLTTSSASVHDENLNDKMHIQSFRNYISFLKELYHQSNDDKFVQDQIRHELSRFSGLINSVTSTDTSVMTSSISDVDYLPKLQDQLTPPEIHSLDEKIQNSEIEGNHDKTAGLLHPSFQSEKLSTSLKPTTALMPSSTREIGNEYEINSVLKDIIQNQNDDGLTYPQISSTLFGTFIGSSKPTEDVQLSPTILYDQPSSQTMSSYSTSNVITSYQSFQNDMVTPTFKMHHNRPTQIDHFIIPLNVAKPNSHIHTIKLPSFMTKYPDYMSKPIQATLTHRIPHTSVRTVTHIVVPNEDNHHFENPTGNLNSYTIYNRPSESMQMESREILYHVPFRHSSDRSKERRVLETGATNGLTFPSHQTLQDSQLSSPIAHHPSDQYSNNPADNHCGGSGSSDYTRFSSPWYPGYIQGRGICSYRLHIRDPSVCQVRIEFLDTDLLKPTEGQCHSQIFSLSGTIMNPSHNSFCGKNHGQHFYVDLLDLRSEDMARWVDFVVTTKAHHSIYKFAVDIQQVKCAQGNPLQAPPGCFQYFYGFSGMIESFNFEGNEYQSDIEYKICVKRSPRSCRAEIHAYNQTSFGLQKLNSNLVPYNRAGVGFKSCVRDYVHVLNSDINGVIEGRRFCGQRLSHIHGDEHNREVSMHPNGDIFAFHFKTGVPKSYNRALHGPGFRLHYQQVPC